MAATNSVGLGSPESSCHGFTCGKERQLLIAYTFYNVGVWTVHVVILDLAISYVKWYWTLFYIGHADIIPASLDLLFLDLTN